MFKTMFASSKRSLIIFSISMLLYGIFIISLYPSIENTVGNPTVEGEGIELVQLEDGSLNLTWDLKKDINEYIPAGSGNLSVYENISGKIGNREQLPFNSSLILDCDQTDEFGFQIFETGEDNYIIIDDLESYQVFWIFYINETGGILVSDSVAVTDLDASSIVDQYLQDTPWMDVFAGGYDLSFATVEGFIVIEYFSLLPLVCAIFFGIRGLSAVTRHVEDRSLDLLLATGYTRRRFLFEKTAVVVVQMMIILIAIYIGLVLGMLMIGEPVLYGPFALVVFGGIPFIFAFIALGTLLSTMFNEYRPAISAVLGIAFIQYIFQVASTLSDTVSFLKWATIFTFWDTNELGLDHVVSVLNIVIALTVAAILYIAAVVYFNRKEIPA
ncbi:MAG: ABC transporter permease subunit [Thermoplasmatota archaeon]